MFFQSNNKNFTKRVMIGLFCCLIVFSQLVFVEPAKAQVPGQPTITTIIEDIPGTVERVAKNTSETIASATLCALMQGFSFLTRKLAYDSARWIASGGKGQGAMAFQKGFGEYLKDTAGATAGEMVGAFGNGIGVADFCSFPDINLSVFMQISLRNWTSPEGPPPKCTWQQLKNGWNNESIRQGMRSAGSSFTDSLPQSTDELFASSLNDNANDFGIALGWISAVNDQVDSDVTGNLLDRGEGDGFMAATDPVSGDIVTPATLIGLEAETMTAHDQSQRTSEQMAGAFGADLVGALSTAGSVFINTLTGELLTSIFSVGALPSTGNKAGGATDFYASVIQSNRREAERIFSMLITSPPLQFDNLNIVSTFAACPQNPGLNNCVIDAKLLEAINASKNETITIQNAIDRGLLQDKWQLIPPDRKADNGDVRRCYMQNYCYSNIQKLRKARIMPLGFEIAAKQSDPDQPWTLGQVVRGFEDCAYVDGVLIPDDPAHPFCHLIDPNWVIKAPVARCEANVYGPELVSPETPVRQQECVDISTCIDQDENGNCKDYGYCLREKNVWDFPGQECPAQFATCKTYTNTRDNTVVSYLSRTVDYGDCKAESIGCSAYSTEKLSDNNWVKSNEWMNFSQSVNYRENGRNQVVYFNEQILNNTCSANNDGCSFFKSATSTVGLEKDAYLKKAPAYLGCYDINISTPNTNWPQTTAELAQLSNNPECEKFANACLKDEVGCDLFTPVTGGLSVPAKIGANTCPGVCAGYSAYRQMASEFEQERDNLYFIPKNGVQCRASSAGCDEFTNLSSLAGGGEQMEYYTKIKYCEKPVGATRDNEGTYYSWEGSESEGYVLKVHKLKKISQIESIYINNVLGNGDEKAQFALGSPAYSDLRGSVLSEKYGKCNQEIYLNRVNNIEGSVMSDPDCREFYDDVGNVYYRLMTDTVAVADSCRPLRKTENYLFDVDNNDLLGIGGPAQICQNNLYGYYNDQKCQICYGGGRYDNGSCVYSALAEQSYSCTAEEKGCRAYAGNLATNVYNVIDANFELNGTHTLDNWDGSRSIAAESVYVGGHSLKASGSVTLDIGPNKMLNRPGDKDVAYEVTFWARGSGQTLNVKLEQASFIADFNKNPITQLTELLSLGNSWQEYHLGPVIYSGVDSTSTTLHFYGSGTGDYYIDNLRLTRVQGTFTLIKNSWRTETGAEVPFVCDTSPADGLPGQALGCQAYGALSSGLTKYTTGFESLCREKAVGCAPYLDTYNTGETSAVAYNVWCPKNESSDRHSVNNGDLCSIYDTLLNTTTTDHDVLLGSCEVGANQTGCFIPNTRSVVLATDLLYGNFIGKTDLIVTSTILIPADTATTTPIYLANRQEFRCTATSLGCQKVGAESHNLPNENVGYDFSDAYILNNPANYKNILCRADQAGCGEFRGDNAISYFKNPKLTGNKLCTYNDGGGDGVSSAGWFLDGVGKCRTSTTFQCRTNDDCPIISGTTNHEACDNIGKIPCYENFISNGSTYELWSNKADNYEGFVGQCESQYNKCTEFIDPMDKTDMSTHGKLYDLMYGMKASAFRESVVLDLNQKVKVGINLNNLPVLAEGAAVQLEYVGGKAYYAIYDENLANLAKECGGLVSQREGCVLFDSPDNPRKLYSAEKSYDKSETTVEENGQSLVSPVSSGYLNSNIIIKVDRNRECSEWLSCKNSVQNFDESGKAFNLCYQYAPCNRTENGVCTNFVSSPADHTQLFLDKSNYVKRDTSWFGAEYSGYSLFEHYPIGDYTYFFVADDFGRRKYMAYQVDDDYFAVGSGYEAKGCMNGNSIKANWSVCGFNSDGRCIDGSCILPVDGSFPSNLNSAETAASLLVGGDILEPISCKSYPEKDSPFGQSVLVNQVQPGDMLKVYGTDALNTYRYNFGSLSKKQDFNGANVCQDTDCSCNYKKIKYKDGTVDYWSINSQVDTAKGICTGGVITDKKGSNYEMNGRPCDPSKLDNECGTGGVCNDMIKEDKVLGLDSFCLERDVSRPINGGSGFACLTWLPIQISVSGIDLYNADPKAGYDPTTDADGYGQVYCAESTATGQGEYVNVDKFVDYQRRFFENYSSDQNSPPLVLLRYDDTVYERCNNGCSEKNGMNAYGFAPRWERNGTCSEYESGTYEECADDINFTSSNNQGFGTIMHPPRFGMENVNNFVMKNPYNLGNYYAYFLSPSKTGDKVSSQLSGSLTQQIWRSPLERSLREEDLKKVYFKERYNYFSSQTEQNQALDELALSGLSPFELEQGTVQMEIDFDYLRGLSDVKPPTKQSLNSYVTQYVLVDEKDSKTPLVNFKNYINSNGTTIDVDDRDVVYKRYVAVWVNDSDDGDGQTTNSAGDSVNAGNSAINVDFGPSEGQVDPFVATECGVFKNNDGGGQHHAESKHSYYGDWLAIGMDFNKDGEFLGYISRYCNSAKIAFMTQRSINVFAQLKDHCSTAALVYDDSGIPIEENTNKAWTDVVWKNAKNINNTLRLGSRLLKDSPKTPFGSMPLVARDINDIVSSDPGNSNLRRNVFVSPDENGIPRSCIGIWLPDSSYYFSQDFRCNGLGSVYDNLSGSSQSGLLNVLSSNVPQSSIDQMFIKTYKIANFRYHLNGAEEIDWPTVPPDKSGDVSVVTLVSQPLPPQVYSLNPITCAGGNGIQKCTAGEKNNMTVNGKNSTVTDYNGDGSREEDRDANNIPDGYKLVGINTQAVVLQFFAFADHNTMPIRRIMVDWDDGTQFQNMDTYGYYKNHKPYCSGSSNNECMYNETVSVVRSSGLTCKDTAECVSLGEPVGQHTSNYFCAPASSDAGIVRFGNSDRACTEGYFEFAYNYSCTNKEQVTVVNGGNGWTLLDVKNQINQDMYNRIVAMGYTDDKVVCVYTPKVQVLDNWGWCNGTCQDENGVLSSEKGCYGQTIIGSTVSTRRNVNGSPQTQCDMDIPGVVGGERWTPYQGYVIVIPD